MRPTIVIQSVRLVEIIVENNFVLGLGPFGDISRKIYGVILGTSVFGDSKLLAFGPFAHKRLGIGCDSGPFGQPVIHSAYLSAVLNLPDTSRMVVRIDVGMIIQLTDRQNKRFQQCIIRRLSGTVRRTSCRQNRQCTEQ